METVYMVRGSLGAGPFNTDFHVKILYLLVFVTLVLWRKFHGRNSDYVWVAFFGTAIWTFSETLLQLGGLRDFRSPTVVGWELPVILSLPIQGMVEGAFVAVVALFFADLYATRKQTTIVVFAFLMLALGASAFQKGVQVPDYGGEVPSRRQMTSLFPLIGLALLTYASASFLLPISRDPLRFHYLRKFVPYEAQPRAWRMFAFMIIFGCVWTLSEWGAGTRWIEVGESLTRHADPAVEVTAFIFDIVIEIAAAYLPFYTIPVGLGLIDLNLGVSSPDRPQNT